MSSHPCMRTCGWCLELSVFFLVFLVFYLVSLFLFQLFLMSHLSVQREVHAKLPARLQLGERVHIRLRHTLTGYEPKQEMNLTDAEELDLTTSSNIYFQNALGDLSSYPNDPDFDDNELAEFLAVVVDRTGKPVEV